MEQAIPPVCLFNKGSKSNLYVENFSIEESKLARQCTKELLCRNTTGAIHKRIVMRTVVHSLIVKSDLSETGTNNTFSNLVELATMTLRDSNKLFQRPKEKESCFCCIPLFVNFQ